MEDQHGSSSGPKSSSTASSVRSKKDAAWEYITESFDETGKKFFLCNFCGIVVRGGGINRMKHHLAGMTGNVQKCKKIPYEVQYRFRNILDENKEKAKEKQGRARLDTYFENERERNDDDDEVEKVIIIGKKGKEVGSMTGKKKQRTEGGIRHYFPAGKGKNQQGNQAFIDALWQSPQRVNEVDKSIARWFYEACIPFNAANSPYFVQMMTDVATMGRGYKPPNYHALRTRLLSYVKEEVKLLVDSYRSHWMETGCTIMGDGWKDARQRPLINFLVYCPKGISFIKSVDTSDFESNAETLCNLFAEIVEFVGPQAVVHIVTDNAANYKAVGRLLGERYPTLSWSPCAAHCVNLILKDIGDLPQVDFLAQRGAKVTQFAYNHKWSLAWLRRQNGWKEILRPGPTRFATTFIALKSLHDHKDHLTALVTCEEFRKKRDLSRSKKAKEVKQIILDDQFWDDILMIVRITAPLIRLLRLVDSDEKPSMGYVYEGMLRVRKAVKQVFCNKKKFYKPFTRIIKERWDSQLRRSLHAAAYALNPAFAYDRDNFCIKPEVQNGLLDVIEHKTAGISKMKYVAEHEMYKQRDRGFGRPVALEASKNLRPDSWWRQFGHDAPNLMALAIRLLSQTASSSGCERNWSVFERIHTKRRNRLEHQRLSDLVYIHYNLRLQHRIDENKRPYDPIDYECIDKLEFWVIEDEPDPELNYEDLEDMSSKENEPVGSSSAQKGKEIIGIEDEDDNDKEKNESDDDNWLELPANLRSGRSTFISLGDEGSGTKSGGLDIENIDGGDDI